MTAPGTKPAGNPMVGCVALLIMGGLALWAFGFFGSSTGSGAPEYSRAPAAPAWQPPAGFALAPGDPSVALRWMERSEFDCTYSSGSCWGIEAVAHDGCSSNLYIELSLQDASGTAIGMTNDTVGSVSPGQRAKLVFDTFEGAATKARISDVSCY